MSQVICEFIPLNEFTLFLSIVEIFILLSQNNISKPSLYYI